MKFKYLFLVLSFFQVCLFASNLKTIEVYETSKVNLVPDNATIYFNIVAQGDDLNDTKLKGNEILEKVEKILDKNKISKNDIETNKFNIKQNLDTNNTIFELRKKIKVSLKTLINHDLLLNELLQTGISDLNIQYNNSNIEDYKLELLKKAVILSKEKASKLASGVNLKVDEVLEIEEIPTKQVYYSTKKITYENPALSKASAIFMEAKIKAKFSLK